MIVRVAMYFRSHVLMRVVNIYIFEKVTPF